MTTMRTVTALALTTILTFGLSACGDDDDDRDDLPGSTQSSNAGGSTTPDATTPVDPEDEPIDDETRQRLEQVALDEVGEGRVEDVERSDDASHAYEVDVELGNDNDVTVEIAEDFTVVRGDS